MTIGKRLEKAMEAAGHKSQKSLEVASGVPQATISRILNDRGTKGPETETLRRIADACRVPFEWLLSGPEDLEASTIPIAKAPIDPDKELDGLLDLISIFRSLSANDRLMLIDSAKDIVRLRGGKNVRTGIEMQ